METWAIVTLVLGTSAISSLLTFYITKMQVKHSDKRFEKELERAREIDSRQRRWQVRSEPLLKLRDELAIMASELDTLIAAGRAQSSKSYTEGSEKDIAEQQIYNKWEKYRTSGGFLRTLHLQYDVELLKGIDAIKGKYLLLFEFALEFRQLKPNERKLFWELSEQIDENLPLIQELINKRLEEL